MEFIQQYSHNYCFFCKFDAIDLFNNTIGRCEKILEHFMSEISQENTKSDFSLTAKIFHWSFVILFAYGISKQIDNINQLEDLALLKFEIAFAFLFILFLLVFLPQKLNQPVQLFPMMP